MLIKARAGILYLHVKHSRTVFDHRYGPVDVAGLRKLIWQVSTCVDIVEMDAHLVASAVAARVDDDCAVLGRVEKVHRVGLVGTPCLWVDQQFFLPTLLVSEEEAGNSIAWHFFQNEVSSAAKEDALCFFDVSEFEHFLVKSCYVGSLVEKR